MAIQKIGVIGAGHIGCGIAAGFASSGYDVTVMDVDAKALERAIDKIALQVDEIVARGELATGGEDAIVHVRMTANYQTSAAATSSLRPRLRMSRLSTGYLRI